MRPLAALFVAITIATAAERSPTFAKAGREGYFFALDASNGSFLWKIQLGGPIQNGPMTYAVAGRQYVAVSASNSLFVSGLP